MDIHGGSAAEELDRMRDGSGNVLIACHQRLGEVKVALDAGHFQEAFETARSLMEKVGHLAAGENTLSAYSGARVIRVDEIEAGMSLPDAGRIAEVKPCDNCGQEGCTNITLIFESGHGVTLYRDQEILVRVGD